jgi:hypothetical protein
LQAEFNDIFGAYNRFFSMCFEHVHKKTHVMEYLVKQGIFGEDDLVVLDIVSESFGFFYSSLC